MQNRHHLETAQLWQVFISENNLACLNGGERGLKRDVYLHMWQVMPFLYYLESLSLSVPEASRNRRTQCRRGSWLDRKVHCTRDAEGPVSGPSSKLSLSWTVLAGENGARGDRSPFSLCTVVLMSIGLLWYFRNCFESGLGNGSFENVMDNYFWPE